MPVYSSFCEAIEASSLARTVAGLNSNWVAGVQSLHLIAMAALVASITLFDLRLLGLSLARVSVSRLADRLLPVTWSAFVVMVLTGGFMFVAKAQVYCVNWVFTTKLVLILLAGINMAVFHFTIYRNVASWDKSSATPLSAKIVGSISVLLWASVVFAGRWIGFVS
jgi:uncharacterized protein DUF6644